MSKFLDEKGLKIIVNQITNKVSAGLNNVNGNGVSSYFEITSVDVINNRIKLYFSDSNAILETVGTLLNDMTVTLWFSLRIDDTRYEKCGYITSIYDEYSDGLLTYYFICQFNDYMPKEVLIPSNSSYGQLRILGYPYLGTRDFPVECAVTTGKDNIVSDSYSDIGGRWCVGAGKYSFARGSTNSVGYCAGSIGSGNSILGSHSFGSGIFNTAEHNGSHGIITGQRNWLKHPRCIVSGYQNYTDNSDQGVFGVISASSPGSLFKVGNGKENNDGTFTRSNAFVVHSDGRCTLGCNASSSMDIPSLTQVRSLISTATSSVSQSLKALPFENGVFTYTPSNTSLLTFIMSSAVRYGQSTILASTSNGVTELPTGVSNLRCIVNKPSTGPVYVEGWHYNGDIYSNVNDTVSWYGWKKLTDSHAKTSDTANKSVCASYLVADNHNEYYPIVFNAGSETSDPVSMPHGLYMIYNTWEDPENHWTGPLTIYVPEISNLRTYYSSQTHYVGNPVGLRVTRNDNNQPVFERVCYLSQTQDWNVFPTNEKEIFLAHLIVKLD